MVEMLPPPPTPTEKELAEHPERFSIVGWGGGRVVYQHAETGMLLVLPFVSPPRLAYRTMVWSGVRDQEVGAGVNLPATIGDMVRLARHEARLSQMELAARAGIRQETVSYVESGKNVMLFTVAELAAAMGKKLALVDPADIGIGSQRGEGCGGRLGNPTRRTSPARLGFFSGQPARAAPDFPGRKKATSWAKPVDIYS